MAVTRKLTPAQRDCLKDACEARYLHRTRCGWQTAGGKPLTGHSSRTVQALVRGGLLRIDNFDAAYPTPDGRRAIRES